MVTKAKAKTEKIPWQDVTSSRRSDPPRPLPRAKLISHPVEESKDWQSREPLDFGDLGPCPRPLSRLQLVAHPVKEKEPEQAEPRPSRVLPEGETWLPAEVGKFDIERSFAYTARKMRQKPTAIMIGQILLTRWDPKKGQCNPSVPSICMDLLLSQNAFNTAYKELVIAGLFETVRVGGGRQSSKRRPMVENFYELPSSRMDREKAAAKSMKAKAKKEPKTVKKSPISDEQLGKVSELDRERKELYDRLRVFYNHRNAMVIVCDAEDHSEIQLAWSYVLADFLEKKKNNPAVRDVKKLANAMFFERREIWPEGKKKQPEYDRNDRQAAVAQERKKREQGGISFGGWGL